MTNNFFIKPPRLKRGDTIGIVAPASSFDADNFKKGIKQLRKLGFKVKYERTIFHKCWSLPGHNKQRAKQINRMFADREVKAILCAKAGYGSAEILPYLDDKIIKENPRIFVGYSDITILLLYMQYVGNMAVFHGPVVSNEIFEGMNSLTLDYFLRVICKPAPLGNIEFSRMHCLRPGEARGILVGGNISLIIEAMGTPYEINTKGRILFLEDIAEDFGALGDYFLKMEKAGKFKEVKGIIFGRMVNCFTAEHKMSDLIHEIFTGLDVPILSGFPSGHIKSRGDLNITLPLGVEVNMDASALSVEVAEAAVG